MIYLDASVALAQLLAEDRAPKIDKSLLTTGEPKRIRSKEHLLSLARRNLEALHFKARSHV